MLNSDKVKFERQECCSVSMYEDMVSTILDQIHKNMTTLVMELTEVARNLEDQS